MLLSQIAIFANIFSRRKLLFWILPLKRTSLQDISYCRTTLVTSSTCKTRLVIRSIHLTTRSASLCTRLSTRRTPLSTRSTCLSTRSICLSTSSTRITICLFITDHHEAKYNHNQRFISDRKKI